MDTKFPYLASGAAVIGVGVLAFIFWNNNSEKEPLPKEISIATPTPTEVFEAEQATPTPVPKEVVTNTPPSPTPPPLDQSDDYLVKQLKDFNHGAEIISMLTDEEIIRKVVRAVYGLSEGRIVREFRPIASPKGQFEANKIGRQTPEKKQELYRINRTNYARYSSFISLFSLINNESLVAMYQFYLPTLESAYQELGIGKDDFHTTLMKAVDVLLDSPASEDAMLLIQPSVMYKFNDPTLEKLPPAHKLMLRMGQENSEALKLELKKFKERLVSL